MNAPQFTPRNRKVEQALSGCRIVEDIAHQSGLRRLVDKIPQTRRSRVQALQEKCIDRGVTRRKLAGMQVPALVIAVRERALHQIEVMAHGPMDDGAVLGLLSIGGRRAMAGNRQDGAGTIGKKYATIGRAHLHHVTREVARRVIQSLLGCRDVAARRVIVWPEMQASAAPLR